MRRKSSMGVHIRMGADQSSTIALVLVVCLFVGFWYYTVYHPPVTNYPVLNPDVNQGVVVYGDSLASGVGARQNEGFVTALEQEFGIDIANYGIAGGTAHNIWSRVDMVTSEQPRITILSIGLTDSLAPPTPKYQVESRLERIINEIHESGSAIILLETVPQYGNMYRSLAREYNTALVRNVTKPIRGKERFMFDEVHPNDDGYQLIANQIEPVLFRLLKQPDTLEEAQAAKR